ncbi:MAG: UTP--glucose-1-phosphate uridylyltransferase [Verrucomicrobia bacterium]|nr:UTP--glucose-1-phosphate uridylyltransferase [Verrucomicrobiota bacterium]MCH8525903.1 UTP--glucose-1-phosphate uridylyltransferase [Kiritimatiellia bacterium]
MSTVLQLIQAEGAERDRALEAVLAGQPVEALWAVCQELDAFQKESDNLYERVRALFFLHAVFRYHLTGEQGLPAEGRIPYDGVRLLHKRRFEEALELFMAAARREGLSDPLGSAIAEASHRLAIQHLANQVRKSVRSVRGNQWMFRLGHVADQTLRIRRELLTPGENGLYPILREQTPVRMDLTHSGWSDIFFLGMDYPEGARVINVSIDLAVHGRGQTPAPPVQAYLRVIDEPVLRLVSVDLGVKADVTALADVYDFAKDYLGLLKAAVIASGLVPPGMEGSGQDLGDVLEGLAGPGRGLELVSHVNGIPKGSRLAVSTNLLASLIAVCMRATGQTEAVAGGLTEAERRIVASRAILGEWLGGSGGGWQDSGGVWPGIKLIEGCEAGPDDPEYGISRGCLLPKHRILDETDVPPDSRRKLAESLILVHGGMAQNVGPILEMVTEKYLLRSGAEWQARQEALTYLDAVLAALKAGDIRELGAITTRNFTGPLQAIIPWATNHYTETLIRMTRERFGEAFWGFWMLGGMSGGGMGFMVDPAVRSEAQAFLLETMRTVKRQLQHALPFAMDPVVYDFGINEHGTRAVCLREEAALMPVAYYGQALPEWVRADPRTHPPARRAELERLAEASREDPGFGALAPQLFAQLLPSQRGGDGEKAASLRTLLEEIGFDAQQQEDVRRQLVAGKLGLARNRLPETTVIEDVPEGAVVHAESLGAAEEALGLEALRRGEVGVITLAAGTGSRWTQGAGVVKGLHPFCRLDGKHRSFLEVHLAKSRKIGRRVDMPPAHVFTTSYLTHGPIAAALAEADAYGYEGPVRLSRGQAVGIRMIPMARDLAFAWEEMPQQLLDAQAQKMKESLQGALLQWAKGAGEGRDYTDNVPMQCLHPVGHWFEVPGLLRNGVLADLLDERPQLQWLMLHNIDTTGADLDPRLLGHHIQSGKTLTYEVISRRIQDMGGGLANIHGRVQLLEGLAMPREDLDTALRYYNSMTTWIHVDGLLKAFGLTRGDLRDAPKVAAAIRTLAARLPTYITLKDVKKRWGHGQEDVFPVSQYEKLWGDMTTLPELDCGFLHVSRARGQQLKDPGQLDGWVRDGSAAYVEGLCCFEEERG